MAPLAGTYQYASQENYQEYLQSLGLSAEQAKAAETTDVKLIIGPVEAGKINVTFGTHSLVLILGKEADYDVAVGAKKKATATLDGETLTLKTKLVDDGSFVEEKVFTPTDDGLTVASSHSKGAKALRRYKRV